MARPKVSEVRNLNDEEIRQEILALKRQLFALRISKAMGNLKKTHEFKHTRRRIAQLLTIQKGSLMEKTTPILSKQKKSKWINAWITKDSKPVRGCLMINVAYIMNFMVGKPLPNRLIISAMMGEIDKPEIIRDYELGSKGLETSWFISSRTIQLDSCPENSPVSVSTISEPTCKSWLAKFPLLIPIDGNSETVKLAITPLSSEALSLDILVLARGEVFRQFEIHIDKEDAKDSDREKILSVEY